uniref:Microfibril associated protein 2 n=1 Tax=Oncorhynchus mykiss TaxID=8022 RepID=A0A8C7RCH6_ONCMY
MRVLLLLSMPVLLLAQPPLYQEPFPFLGEFIHNSAIPLLLTISLSPLLSDNPDTDVQQQILSQVPQMFPGPERPGLSEQETEPTEPGPLDCREEQYPCTRLYSVHKPCKQCLNSLCFYSLRRVYVVNKEVCVRTVCAHEELLRADMCRDQFPRCGVAAVSGQCGSLGSSCGKSCGGC